MRDDPKATSDYPMTPQNSIDVRSAIVEALRLDLVGPTNDHPCANELLPESPRRWYLTGYLVPTTLPSDAKKADESEEDDVDSPAAPASPNDGGDADKVVARKGVLPSSLGLSVLVGQGVASLTATVEWGDYVYEGPEGTEAVDGSCTDGDGVAAAAVRAVRGPRGYRRLPKSSRVVIPLQPSVPRLPLPGSDGLEIVTTVRQIPDAALGATKLPKGTRSVAVFLVNNRQPDTEKAYTRFAFQPRLRLESPQPFVPRRISAVMMARSQATRLTNASPMFSIATSLTTPLVTEYPRCGQSAMAMCAVWWNRLGFPRRKLSVLSPDSSMASRSRWKLLQPYRTARLSKPLSSRSSQSIVNGSAPSVPPRDH